MANKVYTVYTLESINVTQSNAIADAFSVERSDIEELAALKNAIYDSNVFISKFGKNLKPHDTWFCFDKTRQRQRQKIFILYDIQSNCYKIHNL